MTTHFQSFLFDLIVWAAFGAWVGYWSATVQHYPHMKRRVGWYILSAVGIGLWTVLTVGLPDTGFALTNFLYVSTLTFVFAMLRSHEIQQIVGRDFLEVYKRIQQSTLMKGGVLHGNSHP
jgi:hypothetical protein